MGLSILNGRIRFNRNELAGAFGDIGTDLPLIIGMLLASGADAASVLCMFGLMQLMTASYYGIPMPVQPLKAVALIVITQNTAPGVIFGGGLAIGLVMLLLSVSGLINWLGRVIPKPVIRGIQFGLGLQLAGTALRDYVPALGPPGYLLAIAVFVPAIALIGNRRYPAALFMIAMGLVYAFIFEQGTSQLLAGASFAFPLPQLPVPAEVWTGFLILALPQIPLSLGNSIYASAQIAGDYFPEKKITVRKISMTYALVNLINPFFGGFPVCHGSGGMAGHYTFGGRTGGSVFIYGLLFLAMGLFFSGNFEEVALLFPKPVLGVILLFEGLALLRLGKDTAADSTAFFLMLLVGLMAIGLPYGYLAGMVTGTLLWHLRIKIKEDLPKKAE